MAKRKLDSCLISTLSFWLCFVVLVVAGTDAGSTDESTGADQNLNEAGGSASQISLVLERLETLEKKHQELEKSHAELNRQFKSLTKEVEELRNENCVGEDVWLLTPPLRGRRGQKGEKGDSGLVAQKHGGQPVQIGNPVQLPSPYPGQSSTTPKADSGTSETWYMPIQNRETRNPSNHFNITAKMTIPDPKEPSETELNLCVNSYHTSGAEDSIASVQLPTGYIFSPIDYEEGSWFMSKRPGNVQRFELTEGNSKMDVYYSEIKGHPPTCLTLAATQQFEVTNAKNPPIHVYEYLNPARKARIVYEPAHNITPCQLCRHTDTCGNEQCD